MVSVRLFNLALIGLSCLNAAAPPVPTTTLSPENRADILMARKMYREAIDIYSLVPETSAARWNKIGIAYHQLMDFKAAKKNYEKAVRLDPQYGEAINNLGTVYYTEKSYHRAIREYKKALRVLPQSASIYSNLGSAYFARHDWKKASDSYEKALSLDPAVFEHHSSFGAMLQEHSVSERAKFHYYLAKTYAKAGMNELALQYLRKCLEEGFGERKRLMQDPEFVTLRTQDAFQQIVKSEPRVL